jgi:ubiquinone/menaquinone biosynthesis C-methylase UbiE
MLDMFSSEFPTNSFSKVLDVGVTADVNWLTSNYFEKYFPVKSKIIALSNQDATFLEEIYPGLQFKRGDARKLPFADNSLDVVFSSAVIEHIGSFEEQKQMIAECFRVAKRGVFLTTPNRWHPMEVHTLLPFLHWSPKRIHRSILKMIGLQFYALEANLNLLDRKTLSRACTEQGIRHFSVKGVKTFGFTSNLVLVMKK